MKTGREIPSPSARCGGDQCAGIDPFFFVFNINRRPLDIGVAVSRSQTFISPPGEKDVKKAREEIKARLFQAEITLSKPFLFTAYTLAENLDPPGEREVKEAMLFQPEITSPKPFLFTTYTLAENLGWLCAALKCKPNDLLKFKPDAGE
jgi:hypothetical protein